MRISNKIIICLTGPKRSGKSTYAEYLKWCVKYLFPEIDCRTLNFADYVKHRVEEIFYQDSYEFNKIDQSDRKDIEVTKWGKTCRELQVLFAEEFMKKNFGKDVFAKILCDKICQDEGFEFIIISDLGFREEYQELLNRFDNILLLQVHKDGTSYEGDSRIPFSKYCGYDENGRRKFDFIADKDHKLDFLDVSGDKEFDTIKIFNLTRMIYNVIVDVTYYKWYDSYVEFVKQMKEKIE